MTRETDRGDHVEGDLERGRACYAERQWAEAFAALQRVESCEPLAYPDLELLIWSAALLGNNEEFLAGLERIGPTNAAMLSTLEPVVTVLLAAWIFDERLKAIVMVGGGLILVAAILLTSGEWAEKPALKNSMVEEPDRLLNQRNKGEL